MPLETFNPPFPSNSNVVESLEEQDESLWNLLPDEVKQYIISFIPQLANGCSSIKNLITVNSSFKNLVLSPEVIEIIANEAVHFNPIKALTIYAWAMEHGNVILAKNMFIAYITYFNFDHISEQKALKIIVSMIQHDSLSALKIFCAAAAQGNKKLVKCFCRAKSYTNKTRISTIS